MFFRSIRTKLTAWYSLVVSVTLISFGLTAYYSTSNTLSENLDRSLKNEVKWLNEILAKKFPRRRPPPVRPPQVLKPGETKPEEEELEPTDEIWNQIYEHTLLSPKKQFIQITDTRGRKLYKSSSLGNDSLYYAEVPFDHILLVSTSEFKDVSLRLAVTQNERMKIYVAYPLEDLNEVLDNLFSHFLILAPIAILLSIGLGWFLANKSLKPVDEMSKTARAITAQNLDQTVPHSGVDDELGRLASTFNEMIARLRSSFDQIKQFSIDASHELRTPLTIMRGEMELVLHSEKSPEEYRRVIASNLEEIIRMSAIVENLLTLSKADLGRLEIQHEVVPLHEIIRDLYEDGEVLAEKKHIKVTLENVDEVNVPGDKVRIRQLLLNLIDNAIKYTPEDGNVSLSLKQLDGMATVSISDTGIGIPTEEIPKIFDRFYRVDKARSRAMGGSGLGLSIAKWIADAHGGKIEVRSEIHRGSTFVVYLPVNSWVPAG
jgi:two-component system OmpR family sensor kinase